MINKAGSYKKNIVAWEEEDLRGKDRYVAWGDSSFWSLEKYER